MKVKKSLKVALRYVIVAFDSFLLLIYLIQMFLGAEFKRTKQVCPICKGSLIIYKQGSEDVDFHLCRKGLEDYTDAVVRLFLEKRKAGIRGMEGVARRVGKRWHLLN